MIWIIKCLISRVSLTMEEIKKRKPELANLNTSTSCREKVYWTKKNVFQPTSSDMWRLWDGFQLSENKRYGSDRGDVGNRAPLRNLPLTLSRSFLPSLIFLHWGRKGRISTEDRTPTLPSPGRSFAQEDYRSSRSSFYLWRHSPLVTTVRNLAN